MTPSTSEVYDDFAEHFHLIFEDWNRTIAHQSAVLESLLTSQALPRNTQLLDCACGIGTQAIGFAQSGHRVTGCDISAGAIARAKREAAQRGLGIPFYVSDMTSLSEIPNNDFDVVVAMDNALPHLTVEQLVSAAHAIGSKLKINGLFIASLRDYDQLITDRPTVHGPTFFGEEGARRIVHQIWEWIDRERYRNHIYITTQLGLGWKSNHFLVEYRCLLRHELTQALESAEFERVQWLSPEQSGYYQPIVLARRK